jgi:hypothetical protein
MQIRARSFTRWDGTLGTIVPTARLDQIQHRHSMEHGTSASEITYAHLGLTVRPALLSVMAYGSDPRGFTFKFTGSSASPSRSAELL